MITPVSSNTPTIFLTPDTANTITIKTGTSFGECLGYCYKEIIINSTNVTYIKSAWNNTEPEVRNETTITQEQWNSLTSLIDLQEFNNLDEIIGCPDCADGGAEWIEISDGSNTKKVTFEYNASVPEIDSLITLLRQHRTEILSKFDN